MSTPQQWADYVRSVTGRDSQTTIARRTGIDQTTISRWLKPSAQGIRRSPQAVAMLARGYGSNVLHAFVAAGYMTAREAAMTTDLSEASDEQLAAELAHRLDSRHSDSERVA